MVQQPNREAVADEPVAASPSSKKDIVKILSSDSLPSVATCRGADPAKEVPVCGPINQSLRPEEIAIAAKPIKPSSSPSSLMKKKSLPPASSSPPPLTPLPIDPDEDFCDLYLGISLQTEERECLVLVSNGEVTANATFTASVLYMRGLRVTAEADLRRLLPNGDDFVLVYIPILKKDENSSCSMALPLSAWEDGKSFVLGFVLYLEPDDKCCVAFIQGDNTIHLALVPRNRIKKFESSTNVERQEAGLEVKLMVKSRSSSRDSLVRHRATLCVFDPDKRTYDLVDTTHWAAKTRRHLSDSETLRDMEESFAGGGGGGGKVSVTRVTEGPRSLLLLRADNRKLCAAMYNKIMETKRIFEELPGDLNT